jgi:hypothetical protein
MGLQVNPDGQTVYDPMAGVTWLADANLAASDTLGLPRCQTPTTPANCVGLDGSMPDASAGQFIINMNAYDHGAGYLGQTNWQLPPVSDTCSLFGCVKGNPMGVLYYTQFSSQFRPPATAAAQMLWELNSASHLAMATWVQRVRQPIILLPPITWGAASRRFGAPCCLDSKNQRRGRRDRQARFQSAATAA